MHRLKHILIFGILTAMISCTTKETIDIEFDRIDGLSEESELVFKGLNVGQVEDIKIISSGKLIVTVELDDKFELPINPEFRIISTNLLGSKSIQISQSDKEVSKNSDSRYCGTYQSENIVDTISNKAINMIESMITNSKNQDSLLIELRRLNENLEQLEKNVKD